MAMALVLGSASRAILAALRSLGRGGVQAQLAWHARYQRGDRAGVLSSTEDS
jgi:hypothetical protein